MLNKWRKRLCKWIASFLTVTLLVNQSCFSVLAEEYEEYEYIEDVTDTDANTNTESGVESNTESDMDVDKSEITTLQYDDEESVIEEEVIESDAEDTVSAALIGDTFTYNELTYKIISDDVDNLQVEVTGHVDGTSASGTLDIPFTVYNGVDKYTVVCIGENAFSGCSNLTSITIPDSVTSIDELAFEGCHSLTSITIPDGVTNIGNSAFYYCYSLTSINIPISVTNIGDFAFDTCSSLTSITIPNSVTYIGDGAFDRCSSLTHITIPDNITTISYRAFSRCSSLTHITIPDSITGIGTWAFDKCSSLTSITIPSNVTIIEWGAFSDCSNLTNVTILNDNISLGYHAFENCANLNSLQIALSENITKIPSIWDDCFSQCPADRSITFLTKDGKTELSDSTTPTLADAVKAYKAVNDGDTNDDYWYGWKLPEAGSVTDNDNNAPDSSDDNNSDSISTPAVVSDTNVISNTDIISINTAPASKDNEPKTGDASHMEVYATIAMIAGLSYLLLYFADGKNGMTEEEKKEIVSALIKWAKKGKRLRKYAALAVIFLVLVYYHSIGKRTSGEWKAVYEK